MKNEEEYSWRGINNMPVKVSNSTIYLGRDGRKDVEETRQIKLSGLPMGIEVEDLKEWLSWYGEVKSDIMMKKVSKDGTLKNIGGIIDASNVEVKMDIVLDFRERESSWRECL